MLVMRRIFTAGDGLVPIDLLRSSIDHLKAAQTLFRSSPSFYDSAGYLTHLSVESLLTAWLLHSTGRVDGHHKLSVNYTELVRLLGAQELSPKDARTPALLDTYTGLRYPNRNQPTEVGTESLDSNNELLDAIFNQVPEQLLEALDAVDPLGKNGRVLMKKIKPTPPPSVA